MTITILSSAHPFALLTNVQIIMFIFSRILSAFNKNKFFNVKDAYFLHTIHNVIVYSAQFTFNLIVASDIDLDSMDFCKCSPVRHAIFLFTQLAKSLNAKSTQNFSQKDKKLDAIPGCVGWSSCGI